MTQANNLAPAWPDGTPLRSAADAPISWAETTDRNGVKWYETRVHFFDTRPRVRVRDKREGEAKVRQYKDLVEKKRMGLISEKQALVAAGVLKRGRLLTVRDIWEAWIAGASDSTRKVARSMWTHHLEPYFGDKKAAELTSSVMEQWEASERSRPGRGGKPLGAKTIRNAFDLLSSAFGRALDSGELDEIPWRGAMSVRGRSGYQPPKIAGIRERLAARGACSSIDELQRLFNAAEAHDKKCAALGKVSDVAHKILIGCLLGCRQGELAGLGWDDVEIDREPAVCTLRHQATDGWRSRWPDWTRPLSQLKSPRPTFRMHPGAVKALRKQRELLRARGWWREDGPVFPALSGTGEIGGWRSQAQVIDPDVFREIATAAGVRRPDTWVPHSMRHTFVTLEAQSQPSLRDLMERSGHQNVQTAMGYMHRAGVGYVESGISPEVGEWVGEVVEVVDPELEHSREVLALLATRDDGLPVATVQRGREVEAERKTKKEKKREENRRAYAVRNGLIGPETSYNQLLATSSNEHIRFLLGGTLDPTLNKMRRRVYVTAYNQGLRAEGKEAATRKANRAETMWKRNYYDALRRNAASRGLLPEGWSPPSGSKPAQQSKRGVENVEE